MPKDIPSPISAVGLSDLVYSSRRRRMLDVVNNLHLSGVQMDIDLPLIAVIGSQSAGKSSLIESISGITLPRANGTCTRCPTECRLSYSTDPWQCVVSLHMLSDKDGRPLGQPLNDQFGDVIYDKDEVEDRIRRAQCAILNPSTDPELFLEQLEDLPQHGELTFSTNTVALQISGPNVQDLSFCDLPGLIASVATGGNETDIDLVKDLVSSYISRQSCIILLTVACETDFQNQGAHRLTKVHDPEGSRTIGVLTKPDRIPGGEQEHWLRYIRNQDEPLEHGWFSVKQPDSQAIAAGITWDEARDKERGFFAVPPWNVLDLEHQNRLGTEKLVEHLSDLLSERISQRLPSVQEELQKVLDATDQKLGQLPKPPSTDALSEVLYHISTFTKLLSKHVEGTPSADGLLQSIRPAFEKFRQAIKATEPDFRPYERRIASTSPDIHRFVPPAFITHEGKPYIPADDSKAIYIDDVMKRAEVAITRELADNYPFVVIHEYITSVISGWQAPAEALFHDIHHILVKYVKHLVAQHFSHYPLLQNRVTSVVTEFVAAASEVTMRCIKWFIAMEKHPRTLNEPYYLDYREHFLSHYKGWRPGDNQPRSSLTSRINAAFSDQDTDPHLRRHVNEILSGLAKIGLHSMAPNDVAKLLPPDRYDTAIDIMASVRAYFQVAHKRFMDNIPMAIDYELILGLDRDQALERALRTGLGIGGTDSMAQCAEFIREPHQVAGRREELLQKRERLEKAQQQLMEVGL